MLVDNGADDPVYAEAIYQLDGDLRAIGNYLLPKISLEVPFDEEKRRTPLGTLNNFASFQGILGHAHVQSGKGDGVKKKYDPGSAFNWGRLRRSLAGGAKG